MKRTIAPLVDGRVRLRLLEESDLPLTLAWRNHDENRRWFFTNEVIDPAQHRHWFERYLERDDDFVFIVEETEAIRQPVGQMALYNIDWTVGRAEFGRLLIGDPRARGLGIAELATARLTDEALSAWGLREIHADCLTANVRAIRVCVAAGFEAAEPVGRITRLFRRR